MIINKVKYKLISAATVLLSLTLSASLAFASGGGPVTAAEPLGVEKDARRSTKICSKYFPSKTPAILKMPKRGL